MDARRFAAVLEKLACTDEAHPSVSGRVRGERRRLARSRRLDAEFAAACGACACFGAPQCPHCGGEGRPGWQVPDEYLFRRYVAPALERLGMRRHEEEPHPTAGWAVSRLP